MPKLDLTHVDDVENFPPLPDSQYFCELVEVEEAQTKNGDELWKLRFEVASGIHRGRFIFDNLVFSEKALKRVKHICSALGLETGVLDLTPDLIKGKFCFITVYTEEYQTSDGKTKMRNTVFFAGYEEATEADVKAAEKEDEETDEEEAPF